MEGSEEPEGGQRERANREKPEETDLAEDATHLPCPSASLPTQTSSSAEQLPAGQVEEAPPPFAAAVLSARKFQTNREVSSTLAGV